MDIPFFKTARAGFCGFLSAFYLTATTGIASEAPTPTPTPRPRTLAAYASSKTLDRSAVDDTTGLITIDSTNLTEYSKRGSMTIGFSVTENSATETPPESTNTAERGKWRKKYQQQRQVIEKLERQRVTITQEIDRIEGGRLTAQNLAHLDQAEAKLHLLDADIKDEKAVLARIVREARHCGAQPGWFR